MNNGADYYQMFGAVASVDWQGFCKAAGVEFVTSGKNVSGNDTNINCPMCARSDSPDPSAHLGLNPKGYYACWRNSSHKGGRPEAIMKLFAGSNEAKFDNFRKYIKYGYAPLSAKTRRYKTCGGECHAPEHSSRMTVADNVFVDYLRERISPNDDTLALIMKWYGLYQCEMGVNAGRIYVPAVDGLDRAFPIISFTGRAVNPKEELRYKAYTNEQSARPVSDIVFGEQVAAYKDVWVLVEGVFDMLKLAALQLDAKRDSAAHIFEKLDFAPIAMCGKIMTDGKYNRLIKLMTAAQPTKILMLPDADAFGACDWLRGMPAGSKKIKLPDGINDPGELDDINFIQEKANG